MVSTLNGEAHDSSTFRALPVWKVLHRTFYEPSPDAFSCGRFLTGAIEEVSASTGVGRLFLGLIVLPIAGNAAEHITAVFVAAKDKMDLAIAVALGSSIQARHCSVRNMRGYLGFPHNAELATHV